MRTGAAALILLLAPSAGAQTWPEGRSSHHPPDGLAFELVVPRRRPGAPAPSLVVILHGAGGTATGMAGALAFLAERGFVVLAPKAAGRVWTAEDLTRVRKLVLDLRGSLGVDAERLHAAGFSNGGWNLDALAFDPQLRFVSATWIAAGHRGGRVPREARKRMGALALAGDQDPNRAAAERTPELLRKKVRRAEVRLQPGLGHEWPRALMPYLGYWLEVMEGRCEPGRDLSFDWLESAGKARESMRDGKRGGLVYFFTREPDALEATRHLQNEAFFDERVRFFGSQLVPLKLDLARHADLAEELGVGEGPAVVAVDAAFERPLVLEGRIRTRRLAAALRRHARKKRMPR